jgi:glycosyltransferase involved in cell wall biosynthesis
MTPLLLVGNYAPHLQPSMARYARGVQAGLASLDVAAPLVEGRELAPPMMPAALRRYLHIVGRTVVYPAALGRMGDVGIAHVLDHSNAALHRRVRARVRVTTCHDIIPLHWIEGDLPGPPMSTAAKDQFRYALDRLAESDHVVCDSEITRDDVMQRLGVERRRTTVVHPGVDERFRPRGIAPVDAAQRPARKRPLVVNVGMGLAYKNTEGLLRACARLAEDIDFTLAIAGRTLTPTQHALVTGTPLESRLELLGRPDDDALVALYQSADVLVFPSHWEGYGWPPLEALACGCPVVVTRSGALPELLDEGAVFVDPSSDEDIAAGIARVLGDPQGTRAAALRGARALAATTWTNTARGLLDVYAKAAPELVEHAA